MNTPYVRTARAVKTHRCEVCCTNIIAKDTYATLTFYSEKLYPLKMCLACKDIYKLFFAEKLGDFEDVDALVRELEKCVESMNKFDEEEQRGCNAMHARKDEEHESH